MTRGYTDEADKILNYLEYGIFDALQNDICADDKDPNNIVEAYTFNFRYHTIPGTNTVIPIMSLGENLDKMSLNATDPVAQAAKKGKAPTLKDVKKSVKSLLKTLIHSTTQMDVLPKRRYAAFKLFYTDETPAEYEPPHFQAGDAEKDKWFFMTHDLDEVPDKWTVGQLNTGHHSVNLSVASIATYLPSSTENDHATFTGTTTRLAAPPTLTPVEEANIRAEQAAKQSKDADARNIVWSADVAVELSDLDAEADDDPDYVRSADGSFVPIGVRNEDGDIEPLAMAPEEAQFGGVSQAVPTRLHDLVRSGDCLRVFGTSPSSRTQSRTSITRALSRRSRSLTSAKTVPQDFAEISGMADMETQVFPAETLDPIQSFGEEPMEDQIEDQSTPKARKKEKSKKDVLDKGLQCECDLAFRLLSGQQIEDESLCFCEGGCGRWYHLCFHSDEDRRIPEQFICFDCRVRADLSWELIKVDLYPKMLSKFKDLALFRRAIKVAETKNPATVADFAKLVGCDNVLARQLFKRLENQGFIIEQTTEIDDLGFAETGSRSKAKPKAKGKQRKNVQKARYAFSRAARATAAYRTTSTRSTKSRAGCLGCRRRCASRLILPRSPLECFAESQPHDSQTQTQDDTQMDDRLLSNGGDGAPRPKKKIKISVAPAVDLAE
ncbi:HORMA domain-containing protein [Mycena sp. CBHHK59/15]|nr:HORMA domain-containing protein [Mycena sp. CBHHK59/15]